MVNGIEVAPTSSSRWSPSTTKIETIEVQYFDGTVTEIEFDSWNEQLLDELIDAADAPEDWSGAVDVEAEDLDREFEDNARSLLVDSERSLAAPLTPAGSATFRRHLAAAPTA